MTKNKLFLVSLGCDKNRVDSERMLGLLEASGFSFTDDEYEADVIVVNTCCFIDDAKAESIDSILEMAAMKTEGKCKKLVVAGCLSERYQDEILSEFPEVDAYIGTHDLTEIIQACALEDETLEIPSISPDRIMTTPGHYEFLKIAAGCNKYCTYCIIPYIRGKYQSYPINSLIEEAKRLVQNGVKELILVAQETSIYGKDLYGKECLPKLLVALCEIPGLEWIRVLYCYPEDITDTFLMVMANEPKICHYIDMPIQHASDRILKKMGRKTSHDDLVRVIEKARRMIPDIVLRTTLISGFPSETEEDHKELCDFVREMRFDHLGVFPYSQEEGTPAAKMPEQIDDAVKIERRDAIMQIQEEIAAEKMAYYIGAEFTVLIDGYLPDEDIYVGRTYMDAPEVDGFFYVKADRELNTGDMIHAKCCEANAYDLYGEMIDNDESTK